MPGEGTVWITKMHEVGEGARSLHKQPACLLLS